MHSLKKNNATWTITKIKRKFEQDIKILSPYTRARLLNQRTLFACRNSGLISGII